MTDSPYALPDASQPSYAQTEEVVNYQDIHAASLRLREEDCLIRTMPAETVRASGLVVPHTRSSQIGAVFYGVVVAHGPGKVVRPKPTSVWIVRAQVEDGGEVEGVFASEDAARSAQIEARWCPIVEEVAVQGRRESIHVPPPW